MKPSSRIIQIAQELTKKRGKNPKDFNEGIDLKVESMTRYLDEEWLAKQPKALIKKPLTT